MRADGVLSALVDRRRAGAGRLVRTRDARSGNAAAVRRSRASGDRLSSRICRAGRGRRAANAASTPACWWTRTGRIISRHRKIHLPGHSEHRPGNPFQNLEKRYFEVGNLPFSTVAGLWRSRGPVHLQRPPLVRDVSAAGTEGGRAGAVGLQHAGPYSRASAARPAGRLSSSALHAGRRVSERMLDCRAWRRRASKRESARSA